MRLRPILKPVLNRILPPLVRFHLRKPRRYRHDGLELVINPGVFHPGMYLSTQYFLEFIGKLELKGRSALELGAGSGLISLWCARAGVEMTASDISSLAVQNISEGAERNSLKLEIVQSDLFQDLPAKQFDYIFINPPYYPGTPTDEAAHAWYCGPEFEYFQRMFSGLGNHTHAGSRVLMILSEDCELDRIKGIGEEHGWKMTETDRQKRKGEWNYIFDLSR